MISGSNGLQFTVFTVFNSDSEPASNMTRSDVLVAKYRPASQNDRDFWLKMHQRLQFLAPTPPKPFVDRFTSGFHHFVQRLSYLVQIAGNFDALSARLAPEKN